MRCRAHHTEDCYMINCHLERIEVTLSLIIAALDRIERKETKTGAEPAPEPT